MLLYIGIDEAGYGPMLGPLCVGVAALRIERWAPGDDGGGAPDVWERLRTAVCRSPRDARGRLAVADSKKLCKPLAQGPGRLAEAERSVLAFLHALNGRWPGTDLELFEALGMDPSDLPWYAGPAVPLPGHADAAGLPIAANLLRQSLSAAGVSVGLLRVARVDESRFNALVGGGASKAETTLAAIADVAPLVLAWMDGYKNAHARLVLDRQGGRTRYEADLSRVLGRPVRTLAESVRASTYELVDRPTARVRVQTAAEADHLPVALASMLAKLAREMSMARFNAYWSQRRPEVKPTAGYAADARRWLADMGPSLSAEERGTLVRRV